MKFEASEIYEIIENRIEQMKQENKEYEEDKILNSRNENQVEFRNKLIFENQVAIVELQKLELKLMDEGRAKEDRERFNETIAERLHSINKN